jgi:hypothetical protein
MALKRKCIIVGVAALAIVAQACTKRRATVPAPPPASPLFLFQKLASSADSGGSTIAHFEWVTHYFGHEYDIAIQHG